MSRAVIVINSRAAHDRALNLLERAPWGTRVEFKAAKRTLPQNDLMWSRLTDIARQLPWHGVKLKAEHWKLVFLDALPREMSIVPNLNGDGFVNLGTSSRDLSKGEMSDLIELITSFGAQHGVVFHDSHDWQSTLDSTESDAIDRTVSA